MDPHEKIATKKTSNAREGFTGELYIVPNAPHSKGLAPPPTLLVTKGEKGISIPFQDGANSLDTTAPFTLFTVARTIIIFKVIDMPPVISHECFSPSSVSSEEFSFAVIVF